MNGQRFLIRSDRAYSWLECCRVFERRENDKRFFEYVKYVKKANFILGPATHQTPRQKKYYISGSDLYRFIRSWKPKFLPLIEYKR